MKLCKLVFKPVIRSIHDSRALTRQFLATMLCKYISHNKATKFDPLDIRMLENYVMRKRRAD